MSERRAARRRRTGNLSGDGEVPAEIRAGVVLELYCPEAVADDLAGRITVANYMTANRLYEKNRAQWLIANGFDPENWNSWPPLARWIDDEGNEQTTRFADGRPWSIAKHRRDNPDDLADFLRRRGLPPDWSPTPLPRRTP